MDAQGNFYGTTVDGGARACVENVVGQGCGTVFEVTPTGTETGLHRFTGEDGAGPWASLVFDAQGNLYGTTADGGAYGFGTVFKLTP